MYVKMHQVLLTAACLVAAVTSNPMCPACGIELENKVAQIEAMLAISNGRSDAITEAFMTEMNTLAKDSNTINTTVSRLVQDGVGMKQGLQKIQVADIFAEDTTLSTQSLGEEVSNLRSHVGEVKTSLEEHLGEVQGQVSVVSTNMEVDKDIQARNLNQVNEKLNENKGMVDAVSGKLGEQNTKLEALEQRLAALAEVNGSPANFEQLQGTVNELWNNFNVAKKTHTDQLTALRNSIQDIERMVREQQ